VPTVEHAPRKAGKLARGSTSTKYASVLNKEHRLTPADREGNIRRIGEGGVAKAVRRQGVLTLTSSSDRPAKKGRDKVRTMTRKGSCRSRGLQEHADETSPFFNRSDPKGLSRRPGQLGRVGKGMGFNGRRRPVRGPAKPEAHDRRDRPFGRRRRPRCDSGDLTRRADVTATIDPRIRRPSPDYHTEGRSLPFAYRNARRKLKGSGQYRLKTEIAERLRESTAI